MTVPLDGSTMVIATETFRPGRITPLIERGEWRRLDSQVVQEYPERFAVRLVDLEQSEA
jgi:hypothetical protein